MVHILGNGKRSNREQQQNKAAATLHCSNLRTRLLAILFFMNDIAWLIDLIKQSSTVSKGTLRSMDIQGLSNTTNSRKSHGRLPPPSAPTSVEHFSL